MRRRALVALGLASMLTLGAGPVRVTGQATPPPRPYQQAADFQADLLGALERGDVEAADRLMRRDPGAAKALIDTLPDPHGQSARTAYEVRRRAADAVIEETVRRVQADEGMRGRLVSVEVGGTAGMEGPGFTPKTADIDFQLRGVDADASRRAAEIAAEVARELGVPRQFDVNPFPAVPDSTPLPAAGGEPGTRQLTDRQRAEYQAAERRLNNPEASVGDATEAVRRDYYERGMAREVQPDGTLSRPMTVEQLYEKRGWPPPEVTPESAFGVSANERSKFGAIDKDAKRVVRGAEALERAAPDVMTAAERQTVDLAREIYRTRDVEKAIANLPPAHPAREQYELLRREGASAADAAKQVVDTETRAAQRLLDKAVETTLQTRLDAVDRTLQMSDRQVVDHWQARAKAGDPHARDWVARYTETPRASRAELVKATREAMAESGRVAVVEAFNKVDPLERMRIASQPRYAGNDLVRSAVLVADARDGTNPLLARAVEHLNTAMGKTTRALNDALPAADTDLRARGALRAADGVVMALAASGLLYNVWAAADEAYRKGGASAALAAFTGGAAAAAKDLSIGLVIGVAVERTALLGERVALALGLGVRGITRTLLAGLIVKDVIDLSRATATAGWRALQDPLVAGALDPASGSGFYAVMKTNPATLAADLQKFAVEHGLDPSDTEAVLRRMIEEYAKESPRWGANMAGMEDRLLDALRLAQQESEDLLTAVALTLLADHEARVAAELEKIESERKALEAKRLAEAEAAAKAAEREARERRKDKEEKARLDALLAAADAEKARLEEERKAAAAAEAERVARERAAQDEAERVRAEQARLEREAAERARAEEARRADPAAGETPAAWSRWRALGERARAEEDARLRAEAERRAEEERALLAAVNLDLDVPSFLPVGGSGAIRVTVTAPEGLQVAGRRVALRVSAGRMDDGSVPILKGRGETVYYAPPEFAGTVTVTASFEGHATTSARIVVGTETPAPEPAPPAPPRPEETLPPASPIDPATGLPTGSFTLALELSHAEGAFRINGTYTLRVTEGQATFEGDQRLDQDGASMNAHLSATGGYADGTADMSYRGTGHGSAGGCQVSVVGTGGITLRLTGDGSAVMRVAGESVATGTCPPESGQQGGTITAREDTTRTLRWRLVP